MAFAGIVGAPLVWLAALQTGYVLAYQACDSRSRWWVLAPTMALTAVTVVTLVIAFAAYRRTHRSSHPQALLADIGLGVAAFMVVVMAASLLPPLVLRPCD